jgi:hypothetical protein
MMGALAAGTALSVAVTGVWSIAAEATMGPAPALYLSWHHPAASYLTLASAATGNGWELFAAVAFIYAACIFTAGMRSRRRAAS